MNNLHTYIQQNNYPLTDSNFRIESPKNESSSPEISKKSEFRVNTFLGIKKPTVQDLISVEEILEIIKNGNEYLPVIEKARLQKLGLIIDEKFYSTKTTDERNN